MDSRLIYAGSKALSYKINWIKISSDSEWIYIGDEEKVKNDIVIENINNHFIDTSLYVSYTRSESFEIEKENIIQSIKNLLGFQNFLIWDTKFKKVIEFNKIGVMRKGEIVA